MTFDPRRGASLVEVVVALGLLAVLLTLSTRTLWSARRALDDAETGLRAVRMLRELQNGVAPRTAPLEGLSVPGSLVGRVGGDTVVYVEFRPDGPEAEPSRRWRLEWAR